MKLFRKQKTYEQIQLPEDRDGLLAMLAEIEEQTLILKEKTGNLFDQKVDGTLSDGEYNIEVSAIGQELETYKIKKELILQRLDRISSDLARSALR